MNIFVGNIPFSANADAIRQLFERFGVVDNVNLITDRETGRFRGFGFVEMPDDNEASTAIEAMHGADMDGRSLTVNEARPREPR
jgi:RNA recognition motif-containing protein